MKHIFIFRKNCTLPSEGAVNEEDIGVDITKENMKEFASHGVWALFARNSNKPWECMQVGKSCNIGEEIYSDVECLSGENDVMEADVVETVEYINQFGKKVKINDKECKYNVYLTPRQQTYKQIGAEYEDFVFVCICCGEKYKDDKSAIEKYAAWKLQALFWRNGGRFKTEKDNVEEPKDIDKIEGSIKKEIDGLVEQYNNQRN